VEGTAGNVTITTTDATNITLSGMSGGASSGGDTVAKRLQISARQIALSGSGGLSGSADGKSALMLDLAGLTAEAVAQADSFAFQDATDSKPKSITFSDLEDAVFANVSGQAAVAAGGALSLDVSAISAQTEMTGDVADADEFMISDGGVLKRADFSVVRDAVFADVSGDATIAAGGALTIGANAVQTGMVHDDVADELAGDGLSASGGVLAVDFNEISAADIAVGADSFLFVDATDNSTKKESLADYAAAIAGDGLAASSGVLAVGVDDSSLELSSDALRVKASGVTNAMLAGSIVASKMNNAIFEDLETLGAPTADGEFLVATGAGAFAYETGNTARTSLGLGTGDSPQFTDLTLSGDLTVNGTTTTVNSTVVAIADKAMVFASGSTNSAIAAADGAGMAIGKDAGNSPLASLLYDGVDSWDVSDHLNLASGQEFKIADASVLSATTLGSSVVGSSLTSVGTIASGTWQGTAVARAYIAADAIDGTKLADDAVDSEHLAAGSIDLEHMSANSVDSDQYVDGSIDRAHLSADVIDGTKIEDDAVDSEHIAAGAIDLAHMSANSVDSDQYVDGSIDTAHIADNQVTLAKMAGLTRGSIISGDASGDPQALALGAANRFFQSDGSDAAWVEMSGDATLSAGVLTLTADSVDSAEIADGAIDLAHMSANSVDSDQYVDGSIDTAHIADSQITLAKMAANSVDSDQYVDGSIDTAHLGDDQVTAAKLNDDIKGDGLQITNGVLSITHVEDRFTGTAVAASAAFPSGYALSQTPSSGAAVSVYFNGIMQSQGQDYSISGTTITLGSSNSLAEEDEVIVKYIKQ
jgi:hypothetical protein